MDFSNAIQQRFIADGAITRLPDKPGVIATGGDSQYAAHRHDSELGLMRSHESERLLGIESVSRANQAAAVFKISFSSRRTRFSRRRRRISSRSSLLSTSSRCPSSASACLHESRIVCADGSNSSARASGCARPGRFRRFFDGTQEGMADVIAALWAPWTQMVRCPRKRVNATGFFIRLPLPRDDKKLSHQRTDRSQGQSHHCSLPRSSSVCAPDRCPRRHMTEQNLNNRRCRVEHPPYPSPQLTGRSSAR